jgi:membrane protein DedA with SNARE-associated domain
LTENKHARGGVALLAVWILFLSLSAYSGVASFDTHAPPDETVLIVVIVIALFIIYWIRFRLQKRT